MNCYDCHQNGRQTAADAVCHDCGAAICADHATEGRHTITVARVTSWHTSVEPSQRRIRCQTCSAAVTAAANLSAGPARTP